MNFNLIIINKGKEKLINFNTSPSFFNRKWEKYDVASREFLVSKICDGICTDCSFMGVLKSVGAEFHNCKRLGIRFQQEASGWLQCTTCGSWYGFGCPDNLSFRSGS